MAVKNVNGHGVTTVAGHHNANVVPAPVSFPATQGPANYQGSAQPKKVASSK